MELNVLYLTLEMLNRGTLDNVSRTRVPHSDGVREEGLLINQSSGKWDTELAQRILETPKECEKGILLYCSCTLK